jgi:hypothetical protein
MTLKTFVAAMGMVVFLSGAVRLAAQTAQTAMPKTIRIGDIGSRLTDQEILDVEKALSPGKPWLLIGETPKALAPPGIQTLGAYLPPTTNLPELRRCSMILMERHVSPAPLTAWAVSSSRYEYAQVAIGGRDFNQVTDVNDSNRPNPCCCGRHRSLGQERMRPALSSNA